MPKLTDDPDALRERINDRSDVDDLLEEASDLEREAKKRKRKVEKSTVNLRKEKEEIEEQIKEIESKHEGYIERRKEAIEARKEAIRMWAQNHRDEALDGVDGRTYESAFGEVQFTRVPFNFSWNDKEKVIEGLKRLGHDEMIRRTEKPPYKRTLKSKPELVRKIDGVTAHEAHDKVSIEVD